VTILVFLFTDIEGSTRLWEQYTDEMGEVIARHDTILQEQVEGCGGRITKHTGDGITAAFEDGEPLACALEIQKHFAAQAWGEIGELRIRVGLHAGEAEWIAGDYHGPPVNCTARIMSAAWGGQILLTPEVTEASPLPEGASLLDLGQHLLKDVSASQQLYQLLHPVLKPDFPPPRTLSGYSIRQAVEARGGQLIGLEPEEMGSTLVATALFPILQGELDPDSRALEGSLGVLEDLGAATLRGFVAGFAGRLRGSKPLPALEIQSLLERDLQVEWRASGERAAALRNDTSRLLQIVGGVEAAMTAASEEVKGALARGLADLGGQFGEFRWILTGVQDTLSEMRDVQREQLAKMDEMLRLQRERVHVPVAAHLPEAGEPPAFLEDDEERYQPPVFVAREQELARLEEFLQRALGGQGRVVFLAGGPGRGKTALLNEFARRAMEADPNLLVASGNCNAYSGVGDPYLPFREVMDMLTGEVEARWEAGTISRERALRLWFALPTVIQALLEHGPHVIGALVRGKPLFSRATAVIAEDDPWLERLRERVERQQSRSDGLEQSHLFQQVTNLLHALAETHPLLLVLDDLQWADTASIGLLFHLGRRLEHAGSRILIAGGYRPEEVALGRVGERHPLEKVLAEFGRLYGEVAIDLGRADKAEDRRFVEAYLESEPNRLGEGFRRALFEHTGGHALFTIELLRAMGEGGDLVRDEAGRWVEGANLDWDRLPPRVEAVIETRIGQLEEELREILTVASVEGEQFTAQVVGRVQEISERKLLQTLSHQLERKYRLVREQGEEQVGRRRLSRYRFAHALFQQYLYNDLSPGECRLLHEEIARVMEELYTGQTEVVAVQLARHYSLAGDDLRALEYATLAADGALTAYANREAEVHYRRALELATADAQRAHILAGLGEALHRLGQFEEAFQAMRQGIRLYQAVEDLDGVARLYSLLARATWWAGDHAGTVQVCEEGLEVVAGAPESRAQAKLLHETGRAFHFAILSEKARPLCQRALEMAERLGAVDVEADALATWGVLPGLRPEEALAALERAAELAEEAGFLHLAGRAHNNLGVLWGQRLGDIRTERHHEERSLELFRQTGDISGETFSLGVLIGALVPMGDLGEAEVCLAEIRRLARELQHAGAATRIFDYSHGLILRGKGDWANAARLARQNLPEIRRLGDLQSETELSLLLAEALLEGHFAARRSSVHELAEAERALTRVLDIFAAFTDNLSVARCHSYISALLAGRGWPEEARSHLEEARSLIRQRSGTMFEAVALWAEGRLDMAEERWMGAVAAFDAMVGLYDRLGVRWYWARGLIDWAEALTARGELAGLKKAEGLLRQSLAAFKEMGADGYVEVVEHRLRALSGEVNAGSVSVEGKET
jgi:adenylate cyclase